MSVDAPANDACGEATKSLEDPAGKAKVIALPPSQTQASDDFGDQQDLAGRHKRVWDRAHGPRARVMCIT